MVRQNSWSCFSSFSPKLDTSFSSLSETRQERFIAWAPSSKTLSSALSTMAESGKFKSQSDLGSESGLPGNSALMKKNLKNSKPQAQITILHIVGSPDSMFYFKQSIFFASPRAEYNKVSYHYAIVHTDELWSFSDSLQDIPINGILPLDEALSKISQMQPDVIIHQLFCTRGQSEYRGIIQNLGFPLIGSSAEIAAICQNKSKTKYALAKHGVKVPEGRIVGKDDDVDLLMKDIPLPCVVKPDMAEDSMGVSVVRTTDQLPAALQEAYKHCDIAVLERFIAGREIRVLVMSDSNSKLTALPPLHYMNIKRDEIRAFEAKYDVDDKGFPTRTAACSRPVRVDAEKEPQLVKRLSECAKSAFRALQMRDFGLFDVRVDDEGIPWILEANPFCSFSERSIVVGIAKYAGLSCEEFLRQMVENALERNRSHVTQ